MRGENGERMGVRSIFLPSLPGCLSNLFVGCVARQRKKEGNQVYFLGMTSQMPLKSVWKKAGGSDHKNDAVKGDTVKR